MPDGRIWDSIRVRPPICYLPPLIEIIVSREIDEKIALELMEPSPQPAVMMKHFEARIRMVKKLVDAKKLDPRMGEIAVKHYEGHLEEIRSLGK